MAIVTNLIRRILGPASLPRYPIPQAQNVSQVYQPPVQTKVTSVPAPIPTPPA